MTFPRLCLLAIALLAATTATADNLDQTHLCKAGIATVMGRDPSTMTARMVNGLVQVSYVRQDDGQPFTYKCKVEGSRIIWGTISGRWRTHPADGEMSYTLNDNTVNVVEKYSDGSALQKSFHLQQLN